jgi:hypothetical protein
MPHRHLGLLVLLASIGCATGPHPALALAAKDFGCDQKALTLHQIFPKRVRIEGCGKEADYVDVCDGYGMDAQCHWARKAADPH